MPSDLGTVEAGICAQLFLAASDDDNDLALLKPQLNLLSDNTHKISSKIQVLCLKF